MAMHILQKECTAQLPGRKAGGALVIQNSFINFVPFYLYFLIPLSLPNKIPTKG